MQQFFRGFIDENGVKSIYNCKSPVDPNLKYADTKAASRLGKKYIGKSSIRQKQYDEFLKREIQKERMRPNAKSPSEQVRLLNQEDKFVKKNATPEIPKDIPKAQEDALKNIKAGPPSPEACKNFPGNRFFPGKDASNEAKTAGNSVKCDQGNVASKGESLLGRLKGGIKKFFGFGNKGAAEKNTTKKLFEGLCKILKKVRI